MTAATMQAFVKHGSTPGDAGLTTVNVPEPTEGEALIRVAACGICGSDLHAVACDSGYERVRTPRMLGHESAGTVAAVARGCQRVRPGTESSRSPSRDAFAAMSASQARHSSARTGCSSGWTGTAPSQST
jgi:D-arabinose 1-dehydrogenase-like Zn-dependent alcohol dehydrogenase